MNAKYPVQHTHTHIYIYIYLSGSHRAPTREEKEMDAITGLLFLALILFLSLEVLRSFAFSKRENLPPGPKPRPIIGSLLELGDKPHKSLARLSEAYGPLMYLKLGQVPTIVISSTTVAKEVLQANNQAVSSRTITDASRAHRHADFSMVMLPVSPLWRNLRKISNSHLLSSKALDGNMDLRNKKVRELLNDVHNSLQAGEAVEIGSLAFRATLNLLSTTFFSMDMADDTNSDTLKELKEAISHMMEELGKPNIADYFPFLQKIDPQGVRRRNTITFRKLIGLFGRILNQRLQLREASSSVKDDDILDALINMMVVDQEKKDDQLDKTIIEHFLLDLFSAGTETTSTTLEWAMAEVVKSPEVMSRARAELDQVIGVGNTVNESDVTRLPYLQAIVKETFRLHPTAPLLIPRKADSDIEINGYTIPRDAQVIVNVWAMGRDSNVWENPDKFMPERFLNIDIDVGGRDFKLIPFGAGRRICPGFPLAMRMLHLMLGSLLHSFDWKLEDAVRPDTLNMEEKFGLTLQMAQPLRAVPVRITRRLVSG